MALNIDNLSRIYFWFDKPVPYKLADGHNLDIQPIVLPDSEIFVACAGILDIDKDSKGDARIISMSYLKFLIEYILPNETNAIKLATILNLCLGWEPQDIEIQISENGKAFLYNKTLDIRIKHKEFEELRKIILYQNFPHYSDAYINPDAKKAMEDVDRLKSADYDMPTLERKIAIIAAHTGITKNIQKDMTLRSHSILWEEVCGEVNYTTAYTANAINAMFGGKQSEFEHWIYKKKRSKYDGYFVSDKEYHKSMGGDGNIQPSISGDSSIINLEAQFNSLKNNQGG